MKTWNAFVEADCGIGNVPGETEEDARRYIEAHVDTGDLGPIRICGLEPEDAE